MALALASVVVGALCYVPLARRVRFWRTGVVVTEGIRFYLDPQDQVITRSILRDGSWEKAETATVRRLLHPGDTFVDVGANVGWYTAVASRAVGDRGRVIAFEPAPTSFRYLSRTVKANDCRNVTLEPKALSDRPGTLTLHIGETNKGHNSILATAPGMERVSVPAVTLDDYFRSAPGRVDLIKIDTEGAEGLILGGMDETFRKNPGMSILMEYHPKLVRATGCDPAAMVGRLYERGYKVATVEAGTGENIPIAAEKLARLTAALEANNAYVNLLVTR